MRRQTQLAEVADAIGTFAPLLSTGQRWQQHGGKNRNDGNHHQEFDKGKARENWARKGRASLDVVKTFHGST